MSAQGASRRLWGRAIQEQFVPKIVHSNCALLTFKVCPMLDRTTTAFSHVKPTDTAFAMGGLRDIF